MVKAVLFDIGSTLISPSPNIDGVFYEKAIQRNHDITYEKVHSYMPYVDKYYEDEYLKDGDFWCSPEGSREIYLDMYRYLAHLCGLEHDAQSIAQLVYKAYLEAQYWRVYGDVHSCLKTLKKRHIQLGVVSNWSSNLQNLLRSLNLMPYFDEVVASADVGYRKPDPMIFTLTLERMKLNPNDVIHVGDRVDADGEGARAAGIEAIIIDRHKLGECDDYQYINSLDELPALI